MSNTPIIISFITCLFGFLIVGLLSSVKRKSTTADYLLAGSSVKPWLVALSAVATNNSGYMFIGMIGFTYSTGLSSIWLMIGWILGDLLMSFLVHPKLRTITETSKSLSFSEVLGRWQGTNFKTFRALAGIITILFLGVYAGAQFKAGSKALHVLFGWNIQVGAIIGAIMVLLYCFSGGLRASIWTDAAQSFVMIAAMSLLFFIAVTHIGGFSLFWKSLENISPHYVSFFPDQLPFGLFGPFIFVLGWFFAGIAVIGQPHIMVRFMTMDSVKHMSKVRFYYYSWYALFYIITIGVGLAARLILPHTTAFDAELALPILSLELLPGLLVGLTLAGLFSATMSTADSQILSCTASVVQDLLPRKMHSFYITKATTVIITIIALFIALYAPSNVFSLVLISWSGLASAFAPLMILYAIGRSISERQAIMMSITGISTIILWRVLGMNTYIYEVLPGILSGFSVYFITLLVSKKKTTNAL